MGLNLEKKVGDCVHIKSSLGIDAVGPSPVDRSKQGTKRSIITDGNGIMLGCVIDGGNRNDAKLLETTIETYRLNFNQTVIIRFGSMQSMIHKRLILSVCT